MIRSRIPGMAQLVRILCEEQAEEGEEKARHFEPEDAAGVNEGSPDRLAKFFGPGRDGASTLGSQLSINRGLLLHRWSFLLHGMSGLRSAVADHSGGNTDADAQFSANMFRLHTQKCSSGY